MTKNSKRALMVSFALATALLFTSCGDEETTGGASSSDVSTDEGSTTTSDVATGDPSDDEATLPAASDSDEADGGGDGAVADEQDGGSDADSDTDSDTNSDSTDGEDSATSEAMAQVQLFATMSALGIEPGTEAAQCIEENQSLISDTSRTGDLVYDAAKCAPEEVASAIGATQTLGDLTTEETSCVMAETMRYMTSLPEDEARAAFNEDEVSSKYILAIVPIAEEKCGVEADRFADEFVN